MKDAANIYQFVVLAGILGVIGYTMVTAGSPNEMAMGALIGVMVGIGIDKKE